jgi:hypothetical protein
MNRIALLVLLVIMAAPSLFSQPVVLQPLAVLPTLPQPVSLHTNAFSVTVLCNAIDVNFNGVLDDGDRPAAVQEIFGPGVPPITSGVLPWGVGPLQRASMSESSLVAWIGDTVVTFDRSTYTRDRSKDVVASGVSAVSRNASDDTMFVSQRPSFTDPGTVAIMYGSTVVRTIDAGVNVQQTLLTRLSTGKDVLLILSEGGFGAANSTLMIVGMPSGETLSVDLGDTGNHFAVNGDSAYVAVNGSHVVHVVDLTLGRISRSVSTGTTGYNGPREVAVDASRLFVSTFANDVRVYRLNDLAYVARLNVGARPEGMLVTPNGVLVTRSYVADGYAADSGVAVFEVPLVTSIQNQTPKTEDQQTTVSIHVNADASVATVVGDAIDERLLIADMNGTVASCPVLSRSQNSMLLDIRHLAAGAYVLAGGARAQLFLITR